MGVDIGTLSGRIELKDAYSGVLDAVSSKVTSFSGDLLKLDVALAAVAASAIAMGHELIAMAEAGSEVQDITEQFAYLTTKVGMDTPAALDKLRSGVHGTISDLDLMKASLKVVSTSFHLTADDMNTMAQAAFMLSKRGIDVNSALSMVFRAVTTGMPRMLNRLGVEIDMSTASKRLAEATAAEAGAVDGLAAKHAKSQAVLDGLTKAVKTAYKAEVDFADKMAAARASVSNFTNALEAQISLSPAVNDAYARIREAVTRTFGSNQEIAIKQIVAAVDWVAVAAGNVGVAFVNASVVIINAIKGIVAWWGELPSSVKDAISVFAEVSLAILALVSVFGSLIKVVGVAYGAIASLAAPIVGVVIEAFEALNTAIDFTIVQLTLLNNTTPVFAARLLILSAIEQMATAIQTVWAAVTVATSVAFATLTTWLSSTTVVMGAHMVVTRALTWAKTELAAVLLAAQLNFSKLTATVGINSIALTLQSATARVATAANAALGVALLTVQAVLIPLVIAWAAWKLGDWLGSFPAVQRALLWMAEKLHIITSETADARRIALGLTSAGDAADASAAGWVHVTKAVVDYQAQITNIGKNKGLRGEALTAYVEEQMREFDKLKDSGATAVNELEAKFSALSVSLKDPNAPQFKEMARQAKALEDAGATLTPRLAGLVSRFDETGKGAKTATKAVQDLFDKLRDGDKDVVNFTAAYGMFSSAQLNNVDILRRLPPEFEKVVKAHKTLTPAMLATWQQATDVTEVITNQGVAMLGLLGVTQKDIDLQKDQGASEAMIAAGYKTSTEALTAYEEKLQTVADMRSAVAGISGKISGKDDELYSTPDTAKFKQAQLDYLAFVNSTTLSETGAQIAAINAVAKAKKDALTGSLEEIKQEEIWVDLQSQHDIDVVNHTYSTIEERIRKSGVLTVAGQHEALDKMRLDYEQMLQWNRDPKNQFQLYAQADIDDQLKKLQDAFNKAHGILSWGDTFQKMGDILSSTFGNINSKFGQVAQIVGNGIKNIVSGFDDIKDVGVRAAMQVSAAFSMLAGIFDQIGGKIGRFLSGLFGAISAIEVLAGKLGQLNQQGQGLSWNAGQSSGSNLQSIGQNWLMKKISSWFAPSASASTWAGGTAGGMTEAGSLGAWSGGTGTGMTEAGSLYAGSGTAAGTSGASAADATSGIGAAMAAAAPIAIMGGMVMGMLSSISAANLEEKLLRELRAKLKETADSLNKTYVSMKDMHTLAPLLGVDLSMEAAWGGHSSLQALQTDFDQLTKDIQTASDKMAELNSITQQLGISWQQLGANAQMYDIDKRTADIAAAFNTITKTYPDQNAGENAAIGFLADSINMLVIDAAKAGQKIPQALEFIVEKMIKLGKISNEAAKAILGLADATMPSLQDINDAANRYGLTLDKLGKKVNQLYLDTTFDQVLKDFNLLTSAGADFTDLMNTVVTQTTDAQGNVVGVIGGMRGQIQSLIQQSQAGGLDIPATMKPIIQKMIDAGELFDAGGKQITDITKLNFAEDYISETDKLIKALQDMTDALNTAGMADIPEYNVPGTGGAVPGENPPGPGSGGQKHPMAQGSGGFRNYGLGTAAVLHGLEAVVRPVDLSALVAQSMAASNLSAAMETGSMNEVLDANRAAVAASTRITASAPTVAPTTVMAPQMDYSTPSERPLYVTVVSRLNNREVAREQIRVVPSEMKRAGYSK
jgi:hypothetical protein